MTRAARPDDDGTYVDVTAFDEASDASPTTPPAPRAAKHSRATRTSATAPTTRPAAAAPGGAARRRPWLIGLAGLVVGIGIGASVASMGMPQNQLPANHPPMTAAPQPAATTPAPLDEAKVAELTARLRTNPKDAAALDELATEYYRVGRFADVVPLRTTLAELQPQNLDNRLTLGMAHFNSEQYAEAEKHFLRATEIEPRNPGAWYNLGFVYLALEPPQTDKAIAAWEKVIEVAPDSPFADTARNHLGALNRTPQLTPSPTPSR